MPRPTFVCEAPGAPADPLARWWWEQSRPPAMVRKSPGPSLTPWFSRCNVCPNGGRMWTWGLWRAAISHVMAHLKAHHGMGHGWTGQP